jgi:hypothetical protein
MRPDDVVLTDADSTEDAMIALACEKHGVHQVPYTEVHAHQFSSEDLVIIRVPRRVALGGEVAGAALGMSMRDYPETVRGRITICFDGWSADPRPLAETPEIIGFCVGCLFGTNIEDADRAQARETLSWFLDEREFEKYVGVDAFEMTGRLWLVANAFPWRCFLRTPDGLMRDLDANEALLAFLLDDQEGVT